MERPVLGDAHRQRSHALERVREGVQARVVVTDLLSLNLRSFRMEVDGLSWPSWAGDMGKVLYEVEKPKANGC